MLKKYGEKIWLKNYGNKKVQFEKTRVHKIAFIKISRALKTHHFKFISDLFFHEATARIISFNENKPQGAVRVWRELRK